MVEHLPCKQETGVRFSVGPSNALIPPIFKCAQLYSFVVEQIQRKFEQDKRKKAAAAKVFLLEARKIKAQELIDQDMVEISERNSRRDMLSLIGSANFFAAA